MEGILDFYHMSSTRFSPSEVFLILVNNTVTQTKILEDALPFLQPHSQSSRKTCWNNDPAKGIQPHQLSPPSTASSTQAAALAQTTATASYLFSQLPVLLPLMLFSHSVVSNSFVTAWSAAHEASCPSPLPGACSNSCHSIVSSSVAPVSSSLLAYPASESFLMSQLIASGGQSIGASTSVLLMNIQV